MAGGDDESQVPVNSDVLNSSTSQPNATTASGNFERHPSKARGRRGAKYPNRCSTCGKSFKKPSDLTRHVRTHTGEKPFRCEQCSREFTVKSTLDSHRKTHGPVKKTCRCPTCGSLFATKGSMTVHMRLHTGARPFQCPHCDMCFRTSGHRKSHVAQHFKDATARPRRTPKVRKSSRYGMVFVDNPDAASVNHVDVGGVASNMDGAGENNQVINIDPTLLQTPGVVPLSLSITDMFGNAASNDIAMQVLQGGIQLQVAGQQAILTGVDNGSGVITQPIQLDASLLQQLQHGNVNLCIDQNAEKHNGSNTVVANVVASTASNSLPETVAPNLIIKSGVDPELTIIQPDFVNKGLSFDLPGIGTAVVAENLLEQFQPQIPSSDHKLMSVSYGGDTDEADDGDNVTGFECADGSLMLGQKFVASSAPVEQEHREEQRNHLCGECGKAFKRHGHLTEHMLTHAGKKDGTAARSKQFAHTCQQCSKSFCKPSQLERHVRIHTGERPFVCMECNRAFNQKNALETHMRKHRGERPHKCSFCSMAFTQKGNLNTHIRRAHRSELTSDTEQQSASATNSANQSLALLTVNSEQSSAYRTDKMDGDVPFA